MTIYDRPAAAWSVLPSPLACLVVLIGIATGLSFLPDRVAAQLRYGAQLVLRPGLALASSSRSMFEESLALLGNLGGGARRLAELQGELHKLEQQHKQLEAEIVWLRSQMASPSASDEHAFATMPVVQARLLPARVLGRQAQSFLRGQGLLDAGADSGVAKGDLVLDLPPAIIDRGVQSGAAAGQHVLDGRRVWGKVSQAQRQISTVLRATDIGFRDLVYVAQPLGASLSIGPRGVLEGTGEPLCRLRQVPITKSVAVGQIVISAGAEGLLDGSLLYGRIERVEQPPGAAHWDIWVRPSMPPELPRQVSIVMTVLRDPASNNHGAPR